MVLDFDNQDEKKLAFCCHFQLWCFWRFSDTQLQIDHLICYGRVLVSRVTENFDRFCWQSKGNYFINDRAEEKSSPLESFLCYIPLIKRLVIIFSLFESFDTFYVCKINWMNQLTERYDGPGLKLRTVSRNLLLSRKGTCKPRNTQ